MASSADTISPRTNSTLGIAAGVLVWLGIAVVIRVLCFVVGQAARRIWTEAVGQPQARQRVRADGP